MPRDFRIWEKKQGKRDAERQTKRWYTDVTLQHGDLLVMVGNMQKCFTHGIQKLKAGTPVSRRLNFTVRQFTR